LLPLWILKPENWLYNFKIKGRVLLHQKKAPFAAPMDIETGELAL